MASEYNLGDKVILNGLAGYWEVVGIESSPGSPKRYVLRIEADHKYTGIDIDCVEFFCCEKTLKRLTSRN
jgi:hypothetical protein